jgi:hypothetical protein
MIPGHRIIGIAWVAVLLLGSLSGQAETPLYSGGEWDFENGFYFTEHMLAGQVASPCGEHSSCDQSHCPTGHVFCVPGDKTAWVGNGWLHWASFPTWETPGFWGCASFNLNQNQANVSRGVRSQEITMTCANGVGVIYRQAAVPPGHRIRVKAMMKFTPNDPDFPPVQHSLGLDPTGGTDPEAATVQWFDWDEQTPSPPQPSRVFNETTETIDCPGNLLTIFIRQLAPEPPCVGQTFMIDDVEVFDVGPLGPAIKISPTALVVDVPQGNDADSQSFTVRNIEYGTLDYTITDTVDWLSVSPDSGTNDGETDTITVAYDTDALPIGHYSAGITVDSSNATNAPQNLTVSLNVSHKPADYDGDGDVDQEDFGVFQACFTGPGSTISVPRCTEADFDDDDDVDQDDFGRFQQCMSGAGVPSDPSCTE